jgi:hypothetical protein
VTTAPPAAPRKPTTWLGCGCASVVALAMATVAAASFSAWRADRRFERMRADPAARRAAVAALLPHDAPPPGYQPVGTMTLPFGLLSMAVLADAAPGGGRAHVERAFFFVDLPDWMGRERKLREVFTGAAGPPGGLRQAEVEFEPREELGRGELAAGGAGVLGYARRGTVGLDESRFGLAAEGAPKREFPGIATMLLFDCAGDRRVRLGLWLAPDPAPERPAAEADFTGTPADPEALRAFLGHFELCS